MTQADLLKLAKAARELASEFAEGRGPHLSNITYCYCAAGQVALLAGYEDMETRTEVGEYIANLLPLDGLYTRFVNMISEATELEMNGVAGAVVFPLLALADRLESAPCGAP